jgi:hypothetical protein
MDVVAAKKMRRIWFQPVASEGRWMFEIYDLVRVDHFETHKGSHMANILVVLEKCPLSGKDADWRALCDQSVVSN